MFRLQAGIQKKVGTKKIQFPYGIILFWYVRLVKPIGWLILPDFSKVTQHGTLASKRSPKILFDFSSCV